jgi:histone-lysine N-methyltransferase SETMAR
LGKLPKFGKWLPHPLTPDQKFSRATICASLISRNDTDPFLDRIVTGDEKWVLYVNVAHKPQWVDLDELALPDCKAGQHPRKVLLCIWWDMKGIVYFDILEPNTTITAERYSYQLEKVQEALREKRPTLVNRRGVVLLHDNAKPHTAKITMAKIKELDWEVLPHPAYSPDLAPSDYHLFRSLQHHTNGRKYENNDLLKTDLADFFHSKSVDFYERGIKKLPLRWTNVVDKEGEYILD